MLNGRCSSKDSVRLAAIAVDAGVPNILLAKLSFDFVFIVELVLSNPRASGFRVEGVKVSGLSRVWQANTGPWL